MRAAVVGCGVAGTARLEAYAPLSGVDLVAVVDPSAQTRARVEASHPELRAHADLAELFAADPVDVVDVCTPPSTHLALSAQAMRAGAHVICEKPVAFTTDDAISLIDVSLTTRRLLYPAHNYAFSPMMRLLAGAEVGQPTQVAFNIERQTHARGSSAWQPDWRRNRTVAGGGILLDHGSHCVYMATRLLGAVPGKVSALARFDTDGLDEAIDVRLHFDAGVVDISLSWVGSRRTNRYAVSGPDGSLEIIDGVARATSRDGTHRELCLESPTLSGTHEQWFADMFADFRAVAADGCRWTAPLEEILSTAQVIEAAYESASLDGQPVRV